MRWDAYNSTVRLPHDLLVGGLTHGFSGVFQELEEGRGRNGYDYATALVDGSGVKIATVLYGGRNGKPHIQAQGFYSHDVSVIVRECWPDHSVTRADSAMDFVERGLFDKLFKEFGVFAKRHGLKFRNYGDDRDPSLRDELAGRTFYVGSRQSLAYLRVYEKGKRELETCNDVSNLPDIDWLRVELEVKPQDRQQRLKLSCCSPQQAWGVSRWTREAHSLLMNSAVERTVMWQPKESDLMQSAKHGAVQYGGAFFKLMELNNWTADDLVQWIEEVRHDNARMRQHVANVRSELTKLPV